MNSHTRTVLTDLKAAVRIGHPESIQAALDGLRALPEVSSNQTLHEDFVSKAIVPMGIILSTPRLPFAIITSLEGDALAAIRAVAAAAYAVRYVEDESTAVDDLARWSNEPRAEVRAAFRLGILHSVDQRPRRALSLVSFCLASESPRLRQLGLQIIAGLPEEHCAAVIPILSSLNSESDPDINTDLVNAMNALANKGYAMDIISLLNDWIHADKYRSWVVTRTLSSSWAAEEPQAALGILRQLALQNGAHKQIVSALRALIRHGAEEIVQDELTRWREDSDENLRAIADKINK
ncbi:MAG: hypothetical protein IIC79_06255 [Chloroflexi bacterium]|nr:hypothetical protein [Chloroflexota bacterium]